MPGVKNSIFAIYWREKTTTLTQKL